MAPLPGGAFFFSVHLLQDAADMDAQSEVAAQRPDGAGLTSTDIPSMTC